MTPEQRRLRAQIGAHSLHAQYDSSELTAKARSRFLASFFEKTDPSLPHEERLRRAEHLLRAHMRTLALRSSKARAKSA